MSLTKSKPIMSIEKERINEDALCVLRKNAVTNQIEIGYVTIEKPLARVIDNFSALLDNPNSTLEQVIDFIRTTDELNLLTSAPEKYRYCHIDLRTPYQEFVANNQETIPDIIKQKDLMRLNQEINPDNYDTSKEIDRYKTEIKDRYILWHKAFSINKTYRLCHEDQSILTFSHRIVGWSNPVYQLTPHFSMEIKTNFGYGNASYFYTKLKYKNIEITPFSEWIDYEYAQFSEIIRYTQSHKLFNEYWLEAMEFSRDACNLSMIDEVKFVEKYIIDECERMVSGLEEIFNKEQFSFRSRYRKGGRIRVDKKGRLLVEFRGEKISGALDFISQILEFEKITPVKSFVERIVECNKKIQPILIEESGKLQIKIEQLTEYRAVLQPMYDRIIKENNDYIQQKAMLQKEISSKEPFGIDNERLEKEFNSRFPKYAVFAKEYEEITAEYRKLIEKIRNNTKVSDNIISYNKKIIDYFVCNNINHRIAITGGNAGSLSVGYIGWNGCCTAIVQKECSLTWVLYSDNSLVISGLGRMSNCTASRIAEGYGWDNEIIPPWHNHLNTITSIIIEYGVENIGNYAFSECLNLTEVFISDSVENIGERAFDSGGRGSCSSINVDRNNPNYSSEDGVLFDKEQTVLIQYPCGKGKKDIHYIIPNGVTSIENMNCKGLSSITIPSSITELTGRFFFSDGSLKNIYMQGKTPPIVSGVRQVENISGLELEYDAFNEVFYDPINKVGYAPGQNIYTCVLHVPVGCKNQYRNAYFWKDYRIIQDELGADELNSHWIRGY